MIVEEQTITEQVRVSYTAANDDGNYKHTETLVVDGTLPAEPTARATWDAARLAEQEAQHATWYALMIAPVVPPTRAQLVVQLGQATSDEASATARIATLTAQIAAMQIGE